MTIKMTRIIPITIAILIIVITIIMITHYGLLYVHSHNVKWAQVVGGAAEAVPRHGGGPPAAG